MRARALLALLVLVVAGCGADESAKVRRYAELLEKARDAAGNVDVSLLTPAEREERLALYYELYVRPRLDAGGGAK